MSHNVHQCCCGAHTAIRLENLSVKLGSVQILEGVTASVPYGMCTAIVGPNGAGKTTTIKMLSCLTKPTSGDALIKEHSIVSDGMGVKECIGVSPQETVYWRGNNPRFR